MYNHSASRRPGRSLLRDAQASQSGGRPFQVYPANGVCQNCYTQTCHLAAQACATFANRGYTVMEMEGGFAAWKAADLDVEREPINRLKRTSERLLHRRH